MLEMHWNTHGPNQLCICVAARWCVNTAGWKNSRSKLIYCTEAEGFKTMCLNPPLQEKQHQSWSVQIQAPPQCLLVPLPSEPVYRTTKHHLWSWKRLHTQLKVRSRGTLGSPLTFGSEDSRTQCFVIPLNCTALSLLKKTLNGTVKVWICQKTSVLFLTFHWPKDVTDMQHLVSIECFKH